MKTRPILFSAPMVRAILAGTKTQTRRIMNPQPRADQIIPRDWSKVMQYNPNAIYGDGLGWSAIDSSGNNHEFRCPYGQPGDRLWVRETFAAHWMYNDIPPSDARSDRCDQRRSDNRWYAADPDNSLGSDGAASTLRGKWRPSIHMPRWASRITLEITGIRVERLNDISEEDAKAEGAWGPDDSIVGTVAKYFGRDPLAVHPSLAYRMLWESINGPGAWDANPWVWAVSFKNLSPEEPCRY